MFRNIIEAIANSLFFLCFVSVTCELFHINVPIFAWMYPPNEGKDFPPGTLAHSIRLIVTSLYFSYKILTLPNSNDKLKQ